MPTWRASSRSGAIRNTEGAELVANGDMELDSNWNNVSTPTTNERSDVQKYAGTYSRKYVSDAIGDGIKSDAWVSGSGDLIKLICFVYSSISTVRLGLNFGDSSSIGYSPITVAVNTWTECNYIRQDTSAGGADAALVVYAPIAVSTVYVDNASAKLLTPSLG